VKRAFLLTGFNNWGKTTQIYSLFAQRRFNKGYTYQISGVNASFTVESHSNDDWDEKGFIHAIEDRIAKSPKGENDLFRAFCPTRQTKNNSKRILSGKPFSRFDEVHLLLLRYKWDFHAELRIKEIQSYLTKVPNVRVFTVDADAKHTADAARSEARDKQIISYLQSLYPED
jgi:hypothetical protein